MRESGVREGGEKMGREERKVNCEMEERETRERREKVVCDREEKAEIKEKMVFERRREKRESCV